MASITQQVPTLTGGISQQADELKVPGQVNVADNVLPDITHGLTKRPGGKLIASLSDNSTTALNSVEKGRWFHYYRDEQEQYIGQISRAGDVNMWSCSEIWQPNIYQTATVYHYNSTNGNLTIETSIAHGLTTSDYVDVSFGDAGYPSGKYSINLVQGTRFRITLPTGLTATNTACSYGKRLFLAGDSVPVEYTSSISSQLTSYLTHANDEDIQTLTVNDTTFFTNRTKTVSMSSTKSPARENEIFIELDQIKYGAQYSLNLFDDGTTKTTVTTVTRIRVDRTRDSNNYCLSNNGEITTHANRHTGTARCRKFTVDDGETTVHIDKNNDDNAPNVGTNIFYVTGGETLRDENPISLSTEASESNRYYDYIPTIYKSDGTTYSNTERATKKNLIFRLTTTGQSTPIGSGSNLEYRTRYSTNHDFLFGGSGWAKGDYFMIFMKDALYKVTIEETSTTQVLGTIGGSAQGIIRPEPTPFDSKTTVTASAILGALKTKLDATGVFSEVSQIGNGLYVKRNKNIVGGVDQNAFNAQTPNTELMNVVSGEVLTVDDLPQQCKHGMVVRVANSQSEDDDYFLKFFGDSGLDGKGVWEECPKPDVNIEYDPATMPIQLQRSNTGETFILNQVAYEQAQCGDTDALEGTNPRASFVGSTINKMIFFRNRLCMLSNENVIMSRPGNFFNFWAKTATTFSNIDVIDVSCSSEWPAIVYDAIQINAGLLIFTKNQQFMLTTDSDLLNPSTVKINALASYNFNEKTNPISLGTTIGFLDNANKYSRFFEMSNLLREGEPLVIEQSKVVSQLFARDLKIVSNSRENSIIFFSEEDNSTLYGYRYFTSGNERALQSWFTWTLTGAIRYHCMLDDALFVVVKNGGKDQLLRYSIKLDDEGHYVTDGSDYPIHLDNSYKVPAGQSTYDPNTKKTSFPIPIGFCNTTAEKAAFDVDDQLNLGHYGTMSFQANTTNFEIDGNWSQGITSTTLTDAGSGFTSAPAVTVSGGGGVNAAVTAAIDSGTGSITSLTITDGGYNYTSTPTITIGTAWQTNQAYTTGTQVVNNGKVYTCDQAGTSAASGSGPTGNGNDITDGTATWDKVGTQPTATATISGEFIIGYNFDMQVQLPTLYRTFASGTSYRSDTRSDLIIHRIKFSFGNVGVYSINLKRSGKPDYTEVKEVNKANTVESNSLTFVSDKIETVPCYERNEHLTVQISSKHPSPATIVSYSWEGDYNKKSYSRV